MTDKLNDTYKGLRFLENAFGDLAEIHKNFPDYYLKLRKEKFNY